MSATKAAGFSSAQRCAMFYAICIPLRLSLAAVVYNFGSGAIVRSTAVVASLASFFFNSKRMREETKEEPVWWHRPVHMLSSIVIAVSFIISPNTQVPSVILMADTLVGLATSVYQSPFKQKK